MNARPRTAPTRAGRLRLSAAVGTALAALMLSACGGGSDTFSSGSDDDGTVTLGSANFPESELLMHIYAQALEADGVEVERRPGIGSREVYMAAFDAGEIDVLPEYNGALLAFLASGEVDPEVTTPEGVREALVAALPTGYSVLEQSTAEDRDSLVVTSETAAAYDLASLADLADVAGDLVLGGAPEGAERYQGVVGLREVYGIEFAEFRALDAGGPLTVAALQDGTIDVASLFSTDSSIPTNDLVVLDDPESLYSAQNIVPLVRTDAATDVVTAALDAVSAALTTENLTDALARVQVDREDPAAVAADFLAEHDLD